MLFFQSKISYLGFDIDKEGLHTSKDKISAIENAPTPNNITQLKSFLGFVQYYAKFVPNLAMVLHPLYNLLKANTVWNWTCDCDEAFKNIKGILTSARVLVHFNPDLPVKLSTDASEYGIGAVISHVFPDNSEKAIAYASRTLLESEKKYSQIEKEGLSIIFGLCKFNQYLYGRRFTLVTDHKPLIAIFHPEKGIPQFSANRLRRWAVILSNYQYNIQFTKSENNTADWLSRLPLSVVTENWEDVDVNYVCYFSENKNLPLNFDTIRHIAQDDPLLREIKNYIIHGWPKTVCEDLKPYFRIKDELTVDSDCVIWNNRLIIPSELRKSVLKDLHKSHIGVVKMKSLARSYVWWPGLNKSIEDLCRTCESCLIHKSVPNKALLDQWPFPEEVWSRIHLDFMGPIWNKQFLIIIDAHSKWLEVFPMTSITSKLTTDVLRSVFARFGLPKQIVTDNATTFCSQEFQNFLCSFNITHITSPPYQPSSNGAAENAVRTVKNALKNALCGKEGANVNEILQNFLFDYRNIAHATTGVCPADIMFRRKLRTRFDNMIPPNLNLNKEVKTDIKNRVLIQQAKQKMYHAGRRCVVFSVGERVAVKDYRQVNIPKWLMAIILKRIGKSTYLVRIPSLNDAIWKRHVNQIKKFNITCSVLPDSDRNFDSHDDFRPNPDSEENTQVATDSVQDTERPKRIIKPVERLVYTTF